MIDNPLLFGFLFGMGLQVGMATARVMARRLLAIWHRLETVCD